MGTAVCGLSTFKDGMLELIITRTGYLGTQGFLAGMAVYTTYLVKGYWGY